MSANDQAFMYAFQTEEFASAEQRQFGVPGPLGPELVPATDGMTNDEIERELRWMGQGSLAFASDQAYLQPASTPQLALPMPEMPPSEATLSLAALEPAPLPLFRQATPHRHYRRSQNHFALQPGMAPYLVRREAVPLFAPATPLPQQAEEIPLFAPAALLPQAAAISEPTTAILNHPPPPQQPGADRDALPVHCPLLRDDNTACSYLPELRRLEEKLPSLKDHIKRAHPWHFFPSQGAKLEDLRRMLGPLEEQTDEDRAKRVKWAQEQLDRGKGAKLHMQLWREIVAGQR